MRVSLKGLKGVDWNAHLLRFASRKETSARLNSGTLQAPLRTQGVILRAAYSSGNLRFGKHLAKFSG